MPVFARTKLVIHDDCLAPAPGSPLPGLSYITINYSGPNPHKVYPEVKKLLLSVFKFEEKDIQEREVVWNRKGNEESFRITLEAVEDLDRFTFMQIIVSLNGKVRPSKEFEKEGEVSIRIEGLLRTEYPQETLWQRSLLYEMFRMFYHRVIYESTRARYKEKCKSLIYKFQDELKKFLNILGR